MRAAQSAGQGWLDFRGRFGLDHCALATSVVRGQLQRCLTRGREIARALELGWPASPASQALLAGSGHVFAEAALSASARCRAENALTMPGMCEARGIAFLHAFEQLPLDEAPAGGEAAAATHAGRSSPNAARRWRQLRGDAHVDLSKQRAEEPRAANPQRRGESLAREWLRLPPPR